MLQASAQKNGIGSAKTLVNPAPLPRHDANSTSSTVVTGSSGTKEEEDLVERRDESDDEEGSEDGSEGSEDEDDGDVEHGGYTHARPESRQEDRRQQHDHDSSRPPSPVKPLGSPHAQSYHYPTSPRVTAAPPPYANGSTAHASHHLHHSESWSAATRQASSHVRAS